MEEKIKTIAIFMGLFQDKKGFWGFDYTPNHLRCHSDRIKDIYQYDRDWNQLMKVVKEIREIINVKLSVDQFIIVRNMDLELNPYDYNIEQVYEAVVKFINFYNKQKEE